ncbi:hypothetical protein Q1695_005544 [Nippostrongylus brasiliensis]|nr:hypothetical protein Q1695_005544 [Nippostrongylus brasiliensis]
MINNASNMVADLVVLLLAVFVDSAFGGENYSFVVENFNVMRGNVLLETTVLSFGECSSRCLEVDECDGFNYFISSSDGKAHCMLVDGNENTTDNSLPKTETVLHAAMKIALKSNCLSRTFAFDKYPAMESQVDADVLEGRIEASEQQCLTRCLERADCRAVQFNRQSSRCDFLRASPNTVYSIRNHFRSSDNVDLYENNCLEVPMSMSRCSFMRLGSAGFTNMHDEISENVGNVEECERICVMRSKLADPCRSYTYDQSTKLCYLSHLDGRSSGRSPLSSQNSNLTHGSLDDCIDFALKCRNDVLEIHGSSMRMFSGSLKTKRNKEVICERKVTGSYHFDVLMPYDECSIDRTDHPFPQYSGLVHVKEGSTTLVTIRDKLLQVNCRIHPQVEMNEQTIMATMEVADSNRTDQILSNKIILVPAARSSEARYSLRVLDEAGDETDVVRAGEDGWLSLSVKEGAQSHIFVSNVIARDVNTKEKIRLIGDDGCVAHDSIVGISRTSPLELRYKINFGGFDKEAQLIYQALVETCTFDCSPKCNAGLWLNKIEEFNENESHVRRRRAIGPRHIELTQDIYKVHGSRITVLTPLTPRHQIDAMRLRTQHALLAKEVKALHEDDVHVEVVESRPIASALQQCFSDDITCLFTVILASIQLFLLVSCICIVYCYIQQWRSYRNFRESLPAQIEIELHNQTDPPKQTSSQAD